MNTLRGRLIASYVLVLVTALALIGGAWLLFLRTSQAFDRFGFLELLATGREAVQEVPRPGGPVLTGDGAALWAQDLAAYSGLRVLVVVRRPRTEGIEIVDSAQLADPTVTPLSAESLRRVAGGGGGGPDIPASGFTGAVQDEDGRVWLGVALNARPGVVVFLQPRGLPIALLRETLLMPLVQALVLGLLLGGLFTLLLSRWVLQPITQLRDASRAIAAGDLSQRVPVSGPEELRSLGESFNEMAAQVQQSHQAQRDFVANVSHELKTPLTSIQGFSQALLDGTAQDAPSAQRAAEVIHAESQRMERMVNELLDLARFDAGQPALQFSRVALEGVLQVVVDRLQARAAQAGVTLTYRSVALPELEADGDRLVQVFANLVDNALKHTPSGGQVTVDAHPEAGGVTIVVRDTGEGIPAAALPRIFERFYQVDPSRRAGSGAGIGLAVTREIVVAHGGRISAESVEGQGSTFTVWLPAQRKRTRSVNAPAQ